MRMIRPLYSTAILLILAAGLGLGQTVWAERQQANADLPLEELQAVAEVYARIRSHYVDEVDDKALLEAAVRGMVSSLDPTPPFWIPASSRPCRRAPAVSSAGWVSRWARRTASSRSSRPSMTPPRAVPACVRGPDHPHRR